MSKRKPSLTLLQDSPASSALERMDDVVIRKRVLRDTAITFERTVAVEVDLSVRDNVENLKACLALSGKPERLVFVVARADHAGAAKARELGANALLHPPLDLNQARRVLFPSLAAAAGVPEDVQAAISDGADVLESLFSGLMASKGPDVDQVWQASESTIEALQGHGLDVWLNAVRQHHNSTFQHCLIVTGVISNFARSIGMSQRDAKMLTTAGIVHDIGKIRIPLAILDKPSALTPTEFSIIKGHPAIGYGYLKKQSGLDSQILSAVRNHHEYLDGSGYPNGVGGGLIDDLTRILTICDVYGALVEERSYHAALPPAKALEILDAMVDEGKLERPLVNALARSVTLQAA